MRLTPAQRAALKGMYDGRCAYCGCELGDRWCADHLEPVIRVPVADGVGATLRLLHPERDTLDNFRPSCSPCNIDKSRMTLEAWRTWLGTRLEALKKQPGFRLLAAHGLVAATGAPVVFYFERIEAEAAAAATLGREHVAVAEARLG